MPLPNLIIIGAQKAGSTSLQHYLELHPDVRMARWLPHEPNFFSHEEHWNRGLGWYEGLFVDAPVRAEKSNAYTAWPVYPDVPERMRDVVPDARLVYVVRDPIDRLLSAWRWRTRHTWESRSLDEALASLDDNEYVARSSYATQLERFLPSFPQDRILVVDANDLRTARDETIRRVYRFAGVEEGFTSPSFDEELQSSEQGRWLSPTGLRIVRRLNRTIGPDRTRRLASLVPARVRVLERPAVPPPVVEGELHARLVERLAPEVDRLRALTGQRFESWSL